MSMTKTKQILVAAALVVATAGVTGRVVSQSQQARMQRYSEPSERHDVLENIAGRWTHEIKSWSRPGTGAELASLTADYRWEYGGRFLVGRFDGFLGGELFKATEILGYNNYRKEFNSFWIDNSTTAFTTAKGHYDDDEHEIVFEGVQDDVERNLRDRKFKITYRFTGRDSMVIEVHREGDDGRMMRTAEVVATREP